MKNILLFAVVSLALVLFGCTEKKSPAPAKDKSPASTPATDPHAGHNHAPGEGHDHGAAHGHEKDGWCLEHEVPEAECAPCNPKIAEKCKKDGDWCNEHQTAKSQCFKCDPSKKQAFIDTYKAKTGKEPPKA